MEAIDQMINDALEQANQLKINSEEKKIVNDIKANYKNYVQVSQQVLSVPRVESTRLGQETFVPTGSANAESLFRDEEDERWVGRSNMAVKPL